MEDDRAFLCRDCGVNTLEIGEYYSVTDALWRRSGLRSDGGMLCIGCLERRIGRRLDGNDFVRPPLSHHPSERIMTRIMSAPQEPGSQVGRRAERQPRNRKKDTDMHVKLHMGDENPPETHVSDSAAGLVRYKFNPSGLEDVQRIKFLAAALISECEAIRGENGPGAREAAIAITDIQKASMMAVAAATAHL